MDKIGIVFTSVADPEPFSAVLFWLLIRPHKKPTEIIEKTIKYKKLDNFFTVNKLYQSIIKL